MEQLIKDLQRYGLYRALFLLKDKKIKFIQTGDSNFNYPPLQSCTETASGEFQMEINLPEVVLSYQVWEKYHLVPGYMKYLSAFSGKLALKAATIETSHPLLFSASLSTTLGLQELLAVYLLLPVEVVEAVPNWVKVESGNQLGIDMVLGGRVLIATNSLEIEIGPMTEEKALTIIKNSSQLQDLITTYLGPVLDYSLAIIIEQKYSSPFALGISRPGFIALGWLVR